MIVVETILRADSNVTTNLGDNADSVRSVRERQEESIAYIVVDQDLVNPNDTQDGQPLQQWEVRVSIVSDTLYETNGAYTIGEDCKSALHDYSGTADGQTVAKIVYNFQTHQLFQTTNEVRMQVEQTYTMYIRP